MCGLISSIYKVSVKLLYLDANSATAINIPHNDVTDVICLEVTSHVTVAESVCIGRLSLHCVKLSKQLRASQYYRPPSISQSVQFCFSNVCSTTYKRQHCPIQPCSINVINFENSTIMVHLCRQINYQEKKSYLN